MQVVVVLLTLLGSITASASTGSLFDAIRAGDILTVENSLDQGADPNLEDTRGDSLVIHALRFNQPEIRKLICARGANDLVCSSLYDQKQSEALINILSDPYHRPTAQAVESLLKAGADPSYYKPGSDTAFIAAAFSGRMDILQLLLKYGTAIDANPRRPAGDGFAGTALVKALQFKNLNMANLLLDYGADPAITGTEGPLTSQFNSYALAIKSLADSNLLARLLALTKSEDLKTSLVTLTCGFQTYSADQIKTYFPVFQSAGIDINLSVKQKTVAQCVSDRGGGVSELQVLADLGAKFSQIVGLNLGQKDDVLSFLIAHGAKASIENLMDVMGGPREQMIVAAMNTNEIYNGNPGIFAPYRITDSGLMCTDVSGKTGVFLALLIQAGFDVNARTLTPQKDGRQPTLLEQCLDETYARQMLLKAGADPNSFDSQKAANSLFLTKDISIFQELLTAGGNLNLKNANGITPGHYLVEINKARFDRNLFELFKKYRLDFSILSPDSRSYAFNYLTQRTVDAGLFAEIVDLFPQALSVMGPNYYSLKTKATPIFYLFYLSDSTRTDLLDVFIKKGADLNSQEGSERNTMLHFMAWNLVRNHSEWLGWFEKLLQANANPDIKNSSGDTVRSYVKDRNRQDLVDLIDQYFPSH